MKRRMAVDGYSTGPETSFTPADRRRLFWIRLAFAAFWVLVAVVLILASR